MGIELWCVFVSSVFFVCDFLKLLFLIYLFGDFFLFLRIGKTLISDWNSVQCKTDLNEQCLLHFGLEICFRLDSVGALTLKYV